MEKQQYILVSREHGVEHATTPVTNRGIKRICSRDEVGAYEVKYELNHRYFPPSEDEGEYYYLELCEGGEFVSSSQLSVSRQSLEDCGFKI